jgi:hypothetical protein
MNMRDNQHPTLSDPVAVTFSAVAINTHIRQARGQRAHTSTRRRADTGEQSGTRQAGDDKPTQAGDHGDAQPGQCPDDRTETSTFFGTDIIVIARSVML